MKLFIRISFPNDILDRQEIVIKKDINNVKSKEEACKKIISELTDRRVDLRGDVLINVIEYIDESEFTLSALCDSRKN